MFSTPYLAAFLLPMTAESITVSLEWAKNIVKAGWNHPTAFVVVVGLSWEQPIICLADDTKKWKEWHKACGRKTRVLWMPTAEEILRRLSPTICYSSGISGDWTVAIDKDRTDHDAIDHTLANAAAAMYCYLAENNLLPPTL